METSDIYARVSFAFKTHKIHSNARKKVIIYLKLKCVKKQ